MNPVAAAAEQHTAWHTTPLTLLLRLSFPIQLTFHELCCILLKFKKKKILIFGNVFLSHIIFQDCTGFSL